MKVIITHHLSTIHLPVGREVLPPHPKTSIKSKKDASHGRPKRLRAGPNWHSFRLLEVGKKVAHRRVTQSSEDTLRHHGHGTRLQARQIRLA